jgi:tetratricopeptide (TPR) repeat protein
VATVDWGIPLSHANVKKKDASHMKGTELYDQVVNWPVPEVLTAILVSSVTLILIAALLLSLGRLRWFARVLGAFGILAIMLTLFVVHEQTTKERVGPYITVTRPRYPESTRFQIRVALLGLPAAAALVMFIVLTTTRRRLLTAVPAYIKSARRHLALGEYDAALAEIHRALSLSPSRGDAYFLRGCVREAQGKIDEALADFDHALSLDGQQVHAYLHRGRLRTQRGELDAALSDFDQVMIMRPNDPECYLNRGICLAKKGAVSDAIQDFQRVLKLTNHTDYAEPARVYLAQLGGENPLPPSMPSVNGSGKIASPGSGQPAGQDYIL